jgi:hypothetical protein
MLALAEYRANRCPGCGHNLAESTAKGGAHQWRVHKRRCHACDAKAITRDIFMQGKPERPEAVLFWTEKVR